MGKKFSVRFTRQSINEDAYRITINADTAEEAEQRFKDWVAGIDELTEEEEQSESHVKDYGIVDSHGDPQLEVGCETIEEDD